MSRRTRKRTIQKRSFLLFELLLAMGLLMLCLFPMIKTHIGIAREEVKQIQAIQREQKARAVFCTIKMDLYEHKYSWDELMQGVNSEAYCLKKLEQSTKHTSESGLILSATFFLGKEMIERTIYVEKAANYPH